MLTQSCVESHPDPFISCLSASRERPPLISSHPIHSQPTPACKCAAHSWLCAANTEAGVDFPTWTSGGDHVSPWGTKFNYLSYLFSTSYKRCPVIMKLSSPLFKFPMVFGSVLSAGIAFQRLIIGFIKQNPPVSFLKIYSLLIAFGDSLLSSYGAAEEEEEQLVYFQCSLLPVLLISAHLAFLRLLSQLILQLALAFPFTTNWTSNMHWLEWTSQYEKDQFL